MKNTDRIPDEDFREIALLAEEQKNVILRVNSSAQTLVIAKFMARRMGPDEMLLVYSRALRMPFYAEILRRSKCQVKVLLDSEEGMSVMRNLPQHVQNRLDCRLVKHPNNAHFWVAGSGFRFVEQLDSVLDTVSNFNDPLTARCLSERFDFFWKSATPLSVLT